MSVIIQSVMTALIIWHDEWIKASSNFPLKIGGAGRCKIGQSRWQTSRDLHFTFYIKHMMLLGNRTRTYFMEPRPIFKTRAVGDPNKGMVLDWVECGIVVFLADWIVETSAMPPMPSWCTMYLYIYCQIWRTLYKPGTRKEIWQPSWNGSI